MATYQIVVNTYIEADSPKEAYRKLLKQFGTFPEDIQWESTNEWYDLSSEGFKEYGDSLNEDEIETICLEVIEEEGQEG